MASGLPALQSGRQEHVSVRTPNWLSKRLALGLQAWPQRQALALLVFSLQRASSRRQVLPQAWQQL